MANRSVFVRSYAFFVSLGLARVLVGADSGTAALPESTTVVLRQYCYACHGKVATGGVSLEQLIAKGEPGENLVQWEKVAAALEAKKMPPPKMPQPEDAARAAAVSGIRNNLREYAMAHAGDPGKVTVRRLTSGEYAYSIRDLTGLELRFDADFATDSVGGEGFTNFGDVQFMQDAGLERYLQAAKLVSDHAVVGAGPLQFFPDPGKSGFELSAIDRIQRIYRANGFRTASGEGGKPFGLDMYSKAFFACWQYQNRIALGERTATLADFAGRQGVSPRFASHLWTVLHSSAPAYPVSGAVALWKKLPALNSKDDKAGQETAVAAARKGAAELQTYVVNWPRMLFAAGGAAEAGLGDERSLALTDETVQPKPKQVLKFNFITRQATQKTRRVFLSVASMNPDAVDKPVVAWRNATVRFRQRDRQLGPEQRLRDVLDAATAAQMKFGETPDGRQLPETDFAMRQDSVMHFDVTLPDVAGFMEFQVTVELDGVADNTATGAVLRCVISDREELSKGRPFSAILGYPDGKGVKAWKAGVLDFADKLPSSSHGEATPSDKDPIPAPYDNTYNQPERDIYHTRVKYYRTDRFLTEKILDDATRIKLEYAWSDVRASFEYHDAILGFIADKFKLDMKGKTISTLTPGMIAAMPAEPRRYVSALRTDFENVRASQASAQAGHLEDCLRFAAKAWRRPLTPAEKDRLRAFYVSTRETAKLDHPKAVRALLTRILVSPAFLYRFEPGIVETTKLVAPGNGGKANRVRALNGTELASRLSYFLWSSPPDEELTRAAVAGELDQPEQLSKQVKRMMADPKARRFSTEFFGQWLGFYRFDQYRGVDTGRYPEFTDAVKNAMYDEAVSFFEYLIRQDRPLQEMLSADYTFLNQALAKHYGLKPELIKGKGDELELVNGVPQRGGLLRLGATLTATSAPLRTSPVKRGDWILRRVLGTPTPPPPADAGSIPADDRAFGGLSVKDRLAAHQKNPVCANCHSRIDPLGFPLERYDAVGRWREQYSDGKPVDDSSVAADQKQISGVDGLVTYLKANEKLVMTTVSKKLLGYALGRTVVASDQALIDRLVAKGGNSTFAQMAAEIVTSDQFRNRRVEDPPAGGVQAGTQSASVTTIRVEEVKR